ncbi:hypothetical protein [Arthrobacter sp. MYb227]|uniref:hypothetical protein n=1 Tax=Arthrobacter sp. MYb227 TaxID=1848601 RepID=UPI0015E38D63|nr:hypothetical protein [Arthrobacter sp. MYb227]
MPQYRLLVGVLDWVALRRGSAVITKKVSLYLEVNERKRPCDLAHITFLTYK